MVLWERFTTLRTLFVDLVPVVCLLVWVMGRLDESLGFFVATPTSSSSICLNFASKAAILAEVLSVCAYVWGGGERLEMMQKNDVGNNR